MNNLERHLICLGHAPHLTGQEIQSGGDGWGLTSYEVPGNRDSRGESLLAIFSRALSPLPQAGVDRSSQMCPGIVVHGFHEFVIT